MSAQLAQAVLFYALAIIVVGGAPLTQDFCDKIGADAYSPDPQGIIEWLDTKVAGN